MNVARLCRLLRPRSLRPARVRLELGEVDGVSDQRRLDHMVHIRLHGHGRTGVDLQQPRLHPFIKHNVEAEDLHAALEVWDQRAEVNTSQLDYELDLCPHHVIVVTLTAKVGFELCKGPLKPTPVPIRYIRRCILVDRAICQVRKDILQVRGVVAFRTEANNSFFE